MRPIDHVRVSPLLVVGSGVAGLSVALASRAATVLTSGSLAADGSSARAQGGIAAALGPGDGPERHAADTVAVGGGLADAAVVAALTAGGPAAIGRLMARGARFDRGAGGLLALGREAAHSARRIVHASGDATGAEVMRALRAAVARHPKIAVEAGAVVLDLATADGRVVGVLADHGGRLVLHLAPAVVLATGGIGRIYAHTTNPPGVDGSGLAMAARAGARLADLEFVQFHPTALDAGGDPMPLLTEALRGEGSVLVDDEGARFMADEHPAADLAPRDVVARAVWSRLWAGRKVFLDATSAVGRDFPDRFPTVFAAAADAGLDPRVDPLPVAPAAHYFMGGIAADPSGRTSIPGLWAVGEAAATGAHGANRLASNSLLEGLVFGERVAEDVAATPAPPVARQAAVPARSFGDVDAVTEVRGMMQGHVGVARDADGLESALAGFGRLDGEPLTRGSRDLVEVATLVATAALARTESRGAHHRTDFPDPDPRQARRAFVTPVPAPVRSIRVER